MRVLFISTHAFIPQRVGGSESSTNDLCLHMMSLGHTVSVMASLLPHDKIWLINRIKTKLLGKVMGRDSYNGYAVYRGWNLNAGLDEVLEAFKPDCVISQAGENIPLIKHLNKLNYKTFVYIRDVSFTEHGGEYFQSENIKYIANSEFTAKKLKATFNISSIVIPPLISAHNYRAPEPKAAEFVLFVCPYEEKGLHIAIELAIDNPNIPFVFLESWPLDEVSLKKLQLKLQMLTNVTFTRAQKNMKQIYQKTKITLMPSICEEAWGRVAAESQINGIPVLASDIGGLPESVGDGGILISPNADLSLWSKALKRLWEDAEFYEEMSLNAIKHAARDEINISRLGEKLESYLKNNLLVNK